MINTTTNKPPIKQSKENNIMAKTAKEYSEILRSVISMSVQEIFAESNYENSDYLRGYASGLLEAIDKINKSQFLVED